jgi:hypothetical protein
MASVIEPPINATKQYSYWNIILLMQQNNIHIKILFY